MTEQKHPRVLKEMRGNFVDAIERSGRAETPSPRRRRIRIGAAVAIGVAAFVAALILVFGVLPGGDVTPADAADELAESAYAVDPPGPDQFAYSLSTLKIVSRPAPKTRWSKQVRRGGTIAARVEFARWLSTTRAGRVSARSETTVAGRTFKTDTEGGTERLLSTYTIGRRQYTPTGLADLGKNPSRAVGDVLAAAATAPPGKRTAARWQYTIDPLRSFGAILPASVRAALIRSLGGIPGVSVAKTAVASAKTETFELVAEGFRQEVTFDDETAVLVRASTTVLSAGTPTGLKPGTKVSEYVLVRSTNVSRVGATR